MILRFLGTGTSTGVPQLRCRCAVCTSTDPHDRRLRCSAMIQTEAGAPWILIDCGPDFRLQMLDASEPELAAALLTHTHYDHVGGVDDLRPYCKDAPDRHFPLYCQPSVARDLRNRVPYCFVEHPYPGVPTFNIHEVEAPVPFTVDIPGFKSVTVEPLAIIHGKLPIIGFKIGSLAYITDASEVPQATIDSIRGIGTLVINALRIAPHHSHLNLLQALNVIELTAPKHAYLTHLSHDMGFEAEARKLLPEGVDFAFDGRVVDISD